MADPRGLSLEVIEYGRSERYMFDLIRQVTAWTVTRTRGAPGGRGTLLITNRRPVRFL